MKPEGAAGPASPTAMKTPFLDERSETVLLDIVEKFIENGEPVSSRCLSKTQPVSPATLRGVMADLEDMGYLRQPHTSAGRVPTDRGYRFFVDRLDKTGIPLAGSESLNPHLEQGNLHRMLEDACGVLSRSSHQAGLVMLPAFSSTLFKRIEFIKVGSQEALAVFFSEMGSLENRVIPIEKDMSQEELTSISNYLNEEFSGRSIGWIRKELLRRLRDEREHYNRLMKKALDLSSGLFNREETGAEALLVNGALNFFDQPEFSADVGQIQALLKALEEKTKLVNLLDLCLRQDGTTVLIGEESLAEELQNCSLIARNYKRGTKNIGTLAIFGPKRMDYKKAISIVNHTADSITQLLSR